MQCPAVHRVLERIVLLAAVVLLGACTSTRAVAPELQERPYLVLVSFDGFRWDYADTADTPNLDRMARDGLKAKALKPVFPTITFPNHYSIATGVQPWRHGIVANSFPDEDRRAWYRMKDRSSVEDGRWYLAEPIWVTAEKAGLGSAAYYFVGTEADVGGVRPGRWRAFDAAVPDRARVNQVLDWLSEPVASRPHVVTLYFEAVDDHGHWYGPASDENRGAIERLDARLGELLDGIAALPHGDRVYVLLVSDHGQGRYDGREPLVLTDWLDLEGVDVVEGGPYAFLYLDEDRKEQARVMRDTVNERWDCGRAYLPSDLPAHWNAGTSPRYPDLFLVADRGCAVLARSGSRMKKLTLGDHGWSPDDPDMAGIFYAVGPRIPAGTRVGEVHVTDVYPMMLEILGLQAPGPVDGDPSALASKLRPVPGNGARANTLIELEKSE